ncbi:MAG: BMC domain-containing protein [Clostridia bacterium]|nr:BMC domain-containing protein [Clostridia bacterium]
MSKAIGVIEYKTVSSGITAADLMIKTSNIEIIQSTVICPGKYVIIVTGELSSVAASIDAAKVQLGQHMVDSFVLGNPAEEIFPAIYGGVEVGNAKSLGVLETFSVPSIIIAADTAAKTSEIKLIELRLARGMAGKSYMLLTGDVAAVTAAIEHAKEVIGGEGMLLDSTVIPNPDKALWENIL